LIGGMWDFIMIMGIMLSLVLVVLIIFRSRKML